MTDSTQELDEILNDYADEHRNHAYEFDNKEISQYEYLKSMLDDKDKAKQALTSLIKELVADAKPPHVHGTTVSSGQFNRGVSEFEQNLLKALEEV